MLNITWLSPTDSTQGVCSRSVHCSTFNFHLSHSPVGKSENTNFLGLRLGTISILVVSFLLCFCIGKFKIVQMHCDAIT